MGTLPDRSGDAKGNAGDDYDKKIAKLIQQTEEMEAFGIEQALTYVSATMLNGTLPHSNRGDTELILQNGNLTVIMRNNDGLPYGHYPRLLLMWISREAVRRKHLPIDEARRIPIGSSVSQFMRDVGLIPKGGKPSREKYDALRRHLLLLGDTSIQIRWTARKGESGTTKVRHNLFIAEEVISWWDNENGDSMRKDAVFVLSREFYQEIVRHAVPLHTLHIAKIARSPLAIDLYQWATYRIYKNNGVATRVTWEQLRFQFGAHYPQTPQGMANFRAEVRKAIKRIKDVWPEAGIKEWEKGVMLYGTITAIEHHNEGAEIEGF